MKISYVTTYDATDVHNWSGLGYHLAQSLQRHQAELDYIGNLRLRHRQMLRMKRMVYDRVFRRKYLMERAPAVAEGYATQLAKRIGSSSQCIFSPGSIPIARLRTSVPKVFYTDTTFAGMLGFYDNYTNLCAESIRDGHQLEQDALDSCALAIFSSDWAARTAKENYKVDPAKVKVVPFGANIESDRSYDAIKSIVGGRSKDICKLLFLGVEWERKGGALAVETARMLNQAGIATELHIAGIRDLPLSPVPDFVRNYGFISKSTKQGRDQIDKLMTDCHLLILPTRAEAYGLVFCEGNSFGMPAIATSVGGIPTIVKDDVNGRLFALTSPAAAYAEYIGGLFSNYPTYTEMAIASFHEFRTRLNWEVSGQKVMQLLQDIKIK